MKRACNFRDFPTSDLSTCDRVQVLVTLVRIFTIHGEKTKDYKIDEGKNLMEDLREITDVSVRKEIKEFVLKNCPRANFQDYKNSKDANIQLRLFE